MELTSSRIEIGVLRLGSKDSAIERVTLEVVHNGQDGDLKRAVEQFVDSNPPEVNELMLTLFCMATAMEKKDGGMFMCFGLNYAEEWMSKLN